MQGSLERCRGGDNHELMQKLQSLPHGSIGKQIAHPPAGHGVWLGKALHKKNLLSQFVELCKAVIEACIVELTVYIVADDKDIAALYSIMYSL